MLTQLSNTMTSLEIAELVHTEHRNVKVSIERLMKKGDIQYSPMTKVDKINNLGIHSRVGVYVFRGEQGKIDSITVVAQLSPSFTSMIVKRWYELEKQIQQQIPQNFADALQLAADQARQLRIQEPKVRFYDKVADRLNLSNATQVAQKIGMSAIELNTLLDDLNVYNNAVKRSRVFKQWFIDQQLGKLKITDRGYTQAMFTQSGEQWVFSKLSSEGLI